MNDPGQPEAEHARKAEATGAAAAADPKRRLLVAGVAALAAAGAMAPEKAKAQLFGGGGGLDLDGLQDLIDLLLQAFEIGTETEIPPSVMRLIDRILELLGEAGGDTLMRSGSVEPALEASFPTEPVTTAAEQAAATVYQAQATRRRVVQSASILATIAEEQGAMTVEEQLLIAEGQVAAAAGPAGVTVLLQAILAMQGSVAQRLGHVSTALGALGQLHADQRMAESNAREQAVRINEEFVGSREVPGPVERRTQ